MILDVITADLGDGARGFCTTRKTGYSQGPFGSFNVGSRCGDSRADVEQNRLALRETLGLPAEPLWLNQVHGNRVVQAEKILLGEEPAADGAVTWTPGFPLAVVTADCLPILCTDGTVAGAFHGGWKGLVAGILENGIAAMETDPSRIRAWIGPSISQKAYQVGSEVREAFLTRYPKMGNFFLEDGPQKWKFDLPGCAKSILETIGLKTVETSGLCTYSDPERFFSFRRENPCGRMGSFIWLKEH